MSKESKETDKPTRDQWIDFLVVWNEVRSYINKT